MLVRFQSVPSIFNEIDSLFNSPLVHYPSVRSPRRFTDVAMKDSGDQLNIVAQLPGIAKEDVRVQLNDGVLTISAERKQPELKENEQWIRNEISYGKYERTIELPYDVDAGKVSAKHENGLLQITLPKSENAKPKQITIQ
jgi:HSP20 family protein